MTSACRATAPCKTAQAVLNLHITESAEIELPGLLVRITDTINGTLNGTDIDDDLWGDMQVTIPGFGEVGMDVWSPFFGTLMAMTACCFFILVSAALEKMFMCVGGEAIHNAVDEQKRINDELHRIIQVVGPIVEKAEAMNGSGDTDGSGTPGSHDGTNKMIQLVTNDGEPMTAPEFMKNVGEMINHLASSDRARSAEAKIGKAAATKVGGSKGAAVMEVGGKVYEHTKPTDQKQSKKRGNKKGNRKTTSVRHFFRRQTIGYNRFNVSCLSALGKIIRPKSTVCASRGRHAGRGR
jgi:hypothetical protein